MVALDTVAGVHEDPRWCLDEDSCAHGDGREMTAQLTGRRKAGGD
jgi:hypothetical protein